MTLQAVLQEIFRLLVILAVTLVLIGGILFFWHQGHEIPEYELFLGGPQELRGLTGILTEASQGKSLGIVQLGILVLLATPVVRIVFYGVLFLKGRDWLYLGICSFVLFTILYSLFWEYF